jgi:hypothetical protein
LRSFYLRFKEEHYEQEQRQVELKQRALEQRKISFLYKVKKLRNNHMSRRQVDQVYGNKLQQLDQLQHRAQELFQESFTIEGRDNEIEAESQYSDEFELPGTDLKSKQDYLVQKNSLEQIQ